MTVMLVVTVTVLRLMVTVLRLMVTVLRLMVTMMVVTVVVVPAWGSLHSRAQGWGLAWGSEKGQKRP